MKFGILVLAAVLAFARLGVAGEVNCKQVKKYLDTGRSVQDVAETMVISESDVKACQEKMTEEGQKQGGEKKGDAAGQGH